MEKGCPPSHTFEHACTTSNAKTKACSECCTTRPSKATHLPPVKVMPLIFHLSGNGGGGTLSAGSSDSSCLCCSGDRGVGAALLDGSCCCSSSGLCGSVDRGNSGGGGTGAKTRVTMPGLLIIVTFAAPLRNPMSYLASQAHKQVKSRESQMQTPRECETDDVSKLLRGPTVLRVHV
jgi:hypothetical protein